MEREDLVKAPTPEEVRAKIDTLRQNRGYVLPHHGALAAGAPALHDAYLRMYRELTLEERHLDPLRKEFVWLMILVAVKEEIGTHHLKLFFEAGGSDELAQVAFRLAGYAGATSVFPFVETHWSDFFSTPADKGYEQGLQGLIGGRIDRSLADLGLCGLYAATRNHWGLAHHLVAANRNGARDVEVLEALTLIMWPVGINAFVEACTLWRELSVAGKITLSPVFKAWAETPDQGALGR
jgi:Uncharacterized homolog of gamma-carboxymuconolactone decarboxylase subunit